MYSLRQIAFKIYIANKSLIITSAITLGISLMLIINMLSLTKNAGKILREEIYEVYGNVDIAVSVSNQRGIDESILLKLQGQNNIRDISRVAVGYLDVENYQVYSIGLDNTELSKSRYKYMSDIGKDEVIINKGLAEFLKISEGDTITIQDRTYKVVDIFDDIKGASDVPDYLMLHIDSFLGLLEEDIIATHLMIDVKDEDNIIMIADNITGIDKNIKVDVLTNDEEVMQNLGMLITFVFILSIICMMISGLLLISNFQTFLYKYRTQISLIKAIGGTSKQAFTIVFIQSLILTTTGISLGVILSYVFHSVFKNSLTKVLLNKEFEYPFVLADALKISVIVFIIIELFMLIPSLKTSKILPLGIVEKNEELEMKGRGAKLIGYSCLLFSLFLFILGAYIVIRHSTEIGLLSALLLIIGVYLLIPYYIRSIIEKVSIITQKFFGNTSFVALKNLIPQVKKNTVIIMVMSLLVTFSVFGGTILNTISKNNENYLKSQYKLDVVLTARQGHSIQIDPNLFSDLKEIKGLKSVVPYSTISTLYSSNKEAIEYARFSMMDFASLQEANLTDKFQHVNKNGVIVTKEFAIKNNLSLGDKILVMPINGYTGGIDTVRVNNDFNELIIEGIFENIDYRMGVDIGIDWSNQEYIDEIISVDKIFIATKSLEQTLQELEGLRQRYPNLKWSTLDEALEVSKIMLNQRLQLFNVTIIAILIGLIIGSQNMMIDDILNKRREYAILRTLRVSQAKLINIILTQVIAFCFIGVVIGGIIGIIISNIISICEANYLSFIDLTVLGYVLLALAVSYFIVLIPFALKISRLSIANELR